MKRIWGLTITGAVTGLAVAGAKAVQRMVAEEDRPLTYPSQFSLKDWKQALVAVKNAFKNRHLSMLAAGVAYYSTLAFFPLMAAAVAIAAFVIAPERLQDVVAAVEAFLPEDLADLISAQLRALSGRREDSLLAAAIAIAISLFGASGAVKSLVTASNVAYGVDTPRTWLRQQARGLVWTIGGISFGFVIAILLVANRSLLSGLGMLPHVTDLLLYVRWALIIILITVGLAVFYRFGPNRTNPTWQWISWGAITATLVWLAGTSLFFVYVQNFSNNTQSYSFFAGIIILMVWFNLSGFAVLLGAAVNHGLEKAASKR